MSTIERTIGMCLGGLLALTMLVRASDARADEAFYSAVDASSSTRGPEAGEIDFGELITLSHSDSTPVDPSPEIVRDPSVLPPLPNDPAADPSPVAAMDPIRFSSDRATSPAPQWILLPSDSLFHSFIAGVHAPRMGGEIVNDDDLGMLLDVTIGGRMPLVRYGTDGPNAQGIGLQVYGAALTRLAMERASDVEATDYKFGVPIVFKFGSTSHQFGYDHLSSHIGDEYLARHPDFVRRNYVRDAIRYAVVQQITEDLDVYADINRAFHTSGGAGTWHFQFGAEYEPFVPAGFHGAPVAAINTELREEFDFEGSLGLVVGWQWRGADSDNLLRLGLSVYSGHSRQYSFFEQYENLVGAGLWYDF